jgi:hypothetical protein
MNRNLILTVQNSFALIINDYLNELLTILVIEIILVGVILFLIAILWNRLNTFKIRILLIITRLHETDVTSIIQRY